MKWPLIWRAFKYGFTWPRFYRVHADHLSATWELVVATADALFQSVVGAVVLVLAIVVFPFRFLIEVVRNAVSAAVRPAEIEAALDRLDEHKGRE